jgi:hypothetical protein
MPQQLRSWDGNGVTSPLSKPLAAKAKLPILTGGQFRLRPLTDRSKTVGGAWTVNHANGPSALSTSRTHTWTGGPDRGSSAVTLSPMGQRAASRGRSLTARECQPSVAACQHGERFRVLIGFRDGHGEGQLAAEVHFINMPPRKRTHKPDQALSQLLAIGKNWFGLQA